MVKGFSLWVSLFSVRQLYVGGASTEPAPTAARRHHGSPGLVMTDSQRSLLLHY